MKFIFCEDNQQKRAEFQAWWGDVDGLNEFALEFASTKEEALCKIADITNNDIVSLDSQLPNPEDGEEILAELHLSGKKCLVLWHSEVAVPAWAKNWCFPFRSLNSARLIQLRTQWQDRMGGV